MQKFSSNFQSFTVCTDTDGTLQRQQDTHSARLSCRSWLRIESASMRKTVSVEKCLLPSANKMTTFKIAEEPREHKWWKCFSRESSMHILERGANRPPVCDSAVGCWNYCLVSTTTVWCWWFYDTCFSYKDPLLLLSCPVAKQWLSLQNWNPNPAHHWLPISPLTSTNGQTWYSLRVGCK